MDTVTSISPDANQVAKKPNGRAGVAYTYFDLDDSLDVGRKIHENAGGVCTPDQLASYLSYKGTKSGTFQTRLSSAKQFGFVRSENGQISVTDRAMQIISPVLPEDAINARADAFLSVELFGKIYEKYRGTTIPPKVGMRNLLATAYSITPDRVDPAVRVLFDSAEQAGFFPAGDQTKLVRPASKTTSRHPVPQENVAPTVVIERPASGGSGDGPTGVHSAIVGLLRDLPPAGSAWSKKGKQRFVKAFLATLDFVYPDDDEDENANN